MKLTWLKGLTGALAELGLSMQACMTAPMEILASVDGMGAITNARVSGDGGISVSAAAMGSLLTSMVGIGWSKDNIKTRTVSASNPPCCRMGVQSCYQFCTSRPDGFQVIPTPSHLLDRISPIFTPFFPVFCAFSPSRRGGSNEPQAGTQVRRHT